MPGKHDGPLRGHLSKSLLQGNYTEPFGAGLISDFLLLLAIQVGIVPATPERMN